MVADYNKVVGKGIAKHKLLGAFSLIMITVGSIDSIRNLPTIALFGGSLIFFFAIATLFFLIPSALVSAELVATWPEPGGIYAWVKRAFGRQMGFLAIWLQWVENIIWYPIILSFAAATIGYLISPSLVDNKMFLIIVILLSFWGVTIVNLLGLRFSAIFSSVCTIFGLLLPMILISWLGLKWYLAGNPMQVSFHIKSFLPQIEDSGMWVALTGIVMSFCGMEIATIHAAEVKNPHRAFPIALLIATLVLVTTLIFSSLSVAIVLPFHKINLVAGVMQTFFTFFHYSHMLWIMPAIAVILVLGSLGGINNWIIAPTKGLSVAAKDGHLPLYFAHENKHRSPHKLLIYQAIVVTLLMLIFLLMPTINASYWLLTVLAAQLYMLMYILLFAAGIVLRFKHPNHPRPFRIPGKHVGMCVVAISGIMGAALTFFVGFVPPHVINIGSIDRFEVILLLGLLIMCSPPFIIYHCYSKRRMECVSAEMVTIQPLDRNAHYGQS